jgi:hypothetical protein
MESYLKSPHPSQFQILIHQATDEKERKLHEQEETAHGLKTVCYQVFEVEIVNFHDQSPK